MKLCRLPSSMALAAAAAYGALPAPASAEGWDCFDSERVDGIYSHYTAAFHGAREPEPFSIFVQMGWKGFYAGWVQKYRAFDDPFVAPDSMSLNVYMTKHVSDGSAEFSRAGVEPITLKLRNQFVRPDDEQKRANMRVEGADVVKALLSHRDWLVTVRDGSGTVVESVEHRFPHDLDGLSQLYDARRDTVRAMAKDIRANCRLDNTDQIIAGG